MNPEHQPAPGSILRFVQQISTNAFVYGAGQMLARATGVLLLLVLARYLPVAELGRFSILMTLLAIFEILTTFGIDRLAVRDLAQDPHTGWTKMPHFLGLSFLLITLGASLLTGGLWFSGVAGGSFLLAAIVGFNLFPITFSAVLDAALQGAQRMIWSALGLILASLVWMIVTFIIVGSGLGLQSVFIGHFLSHALRLGVLCLAAPRVSLFRLQLTRWRPILTEAMPYALSAALGIIQLRQDLLLLGWLKGETLAGLYSVAFKFVEVAMACSLVGLVALVPTMAQLHAKPQQLQMVYLTALEIGALIALPIAIGVSAYAESLLRLLFPSEYLSATPILQVLAWTIAAYIVYIPNMAVLLSGQFRRPLIVASVTMTVVSLLLNIMLIPLLEAEGAAWAALGAFCTGALLSMYFIQRELFARGSHLLYRALLPAVMGGITLALSVQLAMNYTSGVLLVVIGMGAYLVVAGLTDLQLSYGLFGHWRRQRVNASGVGG